MLEDEIYMLERAVNDLFALRTVAQLTVGAEGDALRVVGRAAGDIAAALAEVQASLESYERKWESGVSASR